MYAAAVRLNYLFKGVLRRGYSVKVVQTEWCADDDAMLLDVLRSYNVNHPIGNALKLFLDPMFMDGKLNSFEWPLIAESTLLRVTGSHSVVYEMMHAGLIEYYMDGY